MIASIDVDAGAPLALRVEYLVNPIGLGEVRPRLYWKVNDNRRGAVQSAYQVLVSSSTDELGRDEGGSWDSGRVVSDQNTHVEYAGAPLESRRRYYWKVRTWDGSGNASPWSEAAWWEMGLLTSKDWRASWISLKPQDEEKPCNPCPFFRKAFTVKGAVRRARAYVTARGIYELQINGSRVGDDVFTPGYTDYNKRIQYQTYDITGLLKPGENAAGAMVGDGWYCGYLGFKGPKNYGKYPGFLAQIEVEYEDGSSDVIVTDRSWKANTGPLLQGDLLMGETWDASLEFPGWSGAGFNEKGWKPVSVEKRDKVPLVSPPGQPVRRTAELKPKSISEPEPGAYVFDLGQNMVGRVRLKVQGEEETKVRLRFAEMLNPDGTIYTTNLRSAKCTDYYILKGNGEEVWEPRFTFHGFRYVEVTGYPGKPELDAVTGVVLNTDAPFTGQFSCSSPMINQLQHNIQWGQRGNYLEVPTDCPQRDERLGWMGDAQIFIRTGCFNMDAAAFFTKWLDDVADTQTAQGSFTDVAPNVGWGNGSAAWVDAGVICPWTIYLCYGDKRILERHYKAMARFINYMRTESPNLIRPMHGYGDWLNIAAHTPQDVISTAYFAHSTRLMSRIAEVLGKDADAMKYEALFQRIKTAFNKEFVSPNGRIIADNQTSYVLALCFDLLPENRKEAAAKYLLEDIERRKGHLSTGFLGTGYLLPVLTAAGHDEAAYKLLNNETFPSWGYTIKHGATTIWERWDGWTHEKGFQDPGMNSFNHYAFGAVGEWMYAKAAGLDLDPAGAGYKQIIIHPRIGGGLTHAEASYDSIHGLIKSAWKEEDGALTLEVVIPANTRATVYIPAPEPGCVTENGKPLNEVDGIANVLASKGRVSCSVSAGSYRFVAKVGA